MGKYSKWNCVLCKELCDHMDCFEKDPTLDNLCIIDKLTSVIRNMQNMEFSGAMRHFAEEHFGYDEESGKIKFPEDSGWDEYDFDLYGIYDAYDARRRRDSRGRYMSRRGGRGRRGAYNMYDNVPFPPYYNMDEDEDTDEDMMGEMGMQNAGGRGGNRGNSRGGNRGGRGRSGGRGGSYNAGGNSGGGGGGGAYPSSTGMGMNNYGGRMPPYYSDGEDDMMYRVRQMNGRPIMEPMYNHGGMKDLPKKLTNEQYKEWAKNLQNDDGSMGPHFTEQQTNEMAKKLGIDFKEYSPQSYWLTANVMYSDYCSSIGKHVQGNDIYGKLAQDFLEDIDGKDGEEKLAAYYYSIVEE